MNDTQKLPKSDLCFYCSRPVDLANRGTVALGDKMAHLQCALEPRDTQNQWVSVSERLPRQGCFYLVSRNGNYQIGYYDGSEWSKDGTFIHSVTHWMDLPEPPTPPKPADPFEAWWRSASFVDPAKIYCQSAWSAAKEHYAKPLPDFEMWAKAHCADGPYLEVEKGGRLINERAARIVWNAAQGKPEA